MGKDFVTKDKCSVGNFSRCSFTSIVNNINQTSNPRQWWCFENDSSDPWHDTTPKTPDRLPFSLSPIHKKAMNFCDDVKKKKKSF